MNLLFIPARYGSTRFPGKPLALIAGLPMVTWTWHQCDKAQGFDIVSVLTDDTRIHLEALKHGCDCICQDVQAVNGTERIAYYVRERFHDDDVVVNVQGDEPLMTVDIPQRLLFNVRNQPQFVWTAVRPLKAYERDNPNVVKCRENNGFVNDWNREASYWHNVVQIGVYGYTVAKLKQYLADPPTIDEKAQGLEQLRWMQPLACFECDYNGIGVDVEEDIKRVEERLLN